MSLLVFSRTDERHDSLVHKGTKTHLKLSGDGAHFISCKQEEKTIVLNQERYLVKVFFLNLRNNGNFAMFIFLFFYLTISHKILWISYFTSVQKSVVLPFLNLSGEYKIGSAELLL